MLGAASLGRIAIGALPAPTSGPDLRLLTPDAIIPVAWRRYAVAVDLRLN